MPSTLTGARAWRKVQAGASISHAAVPQHLDVLREAGLVTVRAEGARRIYALDDVGIASAQEWLARLADPLRPFAQRLDALETEVARERWERRGSRGGGAGQVTRGLRAGPSTVEPYGG